MQWVIFQSLNPLSGKESFRQLNHLDWKVKIQCLNPLSGKESFRQENENFVFAGLIKVLIP